MRRWEPWGCVFGITKGSKGRVWAAGNRAMGLQANVSAPPATTVDAKRGVVTSGTAMLSFFLADPGTGDESGPHEGTAAAAAQAHAVPRRCA